MLTSRSLRHCVTALAAAVLLPAALAAQACLGNPSFAQGHLQLSGDVMTGNDATSFGAGWGGGSESVFGGVFAGGTTFKGVTGTQLLAGANIGYQVPATAGTAQICPLLSAQFGFGPKDIDGFGTDLTSRAVGFGLALGGELVRGSRLAIVPSVQLGFAYSANIFDGVGGSVEEADTYGTAGLALGLVLNDQLSVRPNVLFPIGLEGADPVFGIGFSLNYGGRR
ncbi:MAG: hypothetical protein KF709_14530 [Gemmatimonadaceae bacterium]|nr:hypothetical protein [Gemmatimonadaceae bacterium]